MSASTMIRKTPERKCRSKKVAISTEIMTEMIQKAANLTGTAVSSKDENESLTALKNLRLDGMKPTWKQDFLGNIATRSPYFATRLAAIERIEIDINGPCTVNASLAQVAKNSIFEETGLIALGKMSEDQWALYGVASSGGLLKIRLVAINRLLTILETQNLNSIWNSQPKLDLSFKSLGLIATYCEDEIGRVRAISKLGMEVQIPENQRRKPENHSNPEHRIMQQNALVSVACNSPFESTRASALSLIDGIVELATVFNTSRFEDTKEAAREKMLKIAR